MKGAKGGIDQRYVLGRARKIVKALSPLSAGDKLWVLYNAINIVSYTSGEREQARTGLLTTNVNLIPRKRGRLSKIQKDFEVRDFIHQFPKLLSAEKLQQALVEEFGAERAPCTETLRSYLKKMAQSTGEDLKRSLNNDNENKENS